MCMSHATCIVAAAQLTLRLSHQFWSASDGIRIVCVAAGPNLDGAEALWRYAADCTRQLAGR